MVVQTSYCGASYTELLTPIQLTSNRQLLIN